MSRLAKKTLLVPSGVTLELGKEAVDIKGPKGHQFLSMLRGVSVEVKKEERATHVAVQLAAGDSSHRANVGTMWSLLQNAIEGVANGFVKTLEIQGVGFRAAMEGKTLVLSLGFVNPVRFTAPEDVTIEVEKNIIKISGHDKQQVGQTASRIRMLKKPEPYKGKGIRYVGEVVRMKAGKKAATGAK